MIELIEQIYKSKCNKYSHDVLTKELKEVLFCETMKEMECRDYINLASNND